MIYTNDRFRFRILMACFILALTACSVTAPSLSEQQVVASAWQALDPNTSSHSLSNWEVLELRRVTGQEITDTFEGKPDTGCVLEPAAPENGAIASQDTYWYIHLVPRPATPLPQTATTFSPTAPPSVPEPFLYQAHFLINLTTGEVAARKLYCVIY